MMVAILLSCGKHLHNHNISLGEEVWVHKTSLTQPLSIEVSVPRQESERSCIYVLGVSFFLFLRYFNLIFELIRQSGISCFSFYSIQYFLPFHIF
jgi:hypothetical protein